jgi:peptide/nickel transport system ATP-binding protein
VIAAGPGTRSVEIDGLTIGYRRRGRVLRVISDVSLHLNAGEAYGLVGESGCGKTTIAMALMRYLPPNAVVEGGRILLDGEDVLTAREATLRRWRGSRIAMVYQDPGSALNPSIRVGDQIAEVYRHHRGMDRAAALDAAGGMLDKVQMTDSRRVLRRYPHELSGGQQQRVMIAMALATDPSVLVLDEPTTGLDATVEAEVLDLVEELRSGFNTSILFISHNLGIVARMCERVGVLYAGRLVEEGPARELFAEPRHPYTSGLLRSVPRLGMRKDTQRLDPIPGSLPSLGASSPGCVYVDRCPLSRDRCRTDPPPLYDVTDRRSSRCHYHPEVPDIPASPEASAATTVELDGPVLLRAEDLVKTYRSSGQELTAVAGVSFEVRRGEIFGLVGESGSGKSSLAKCIVGLVDASEGRLAFDGDELASSAQSRGRDLRRRLQMVFQNPDTALNPRHTIRRILGRALRLLAGLGARLAAGGADARARRLGQARAASPRRAAPGALRRPEAARGHRPVLRRVAVHGALRRAGLRPRRVRPGRHPQPARRPAAHGRLVRVHLPRPRRGAVPRRPDRGHVPRRARRGRSRGVRLRAPAPPLHGGARVGDPGARPRRPAPPDQAPGTHAQPKPAALGLPLPHPLSPQARRRLRDPVAAVARRRPRPPDPLPPRARRPARAAGHRAP